MDPHMIRFCVPGGHEEETEGQRWFTVPSVTASGKWYYEPESAVSVSCCADHLPRGYIVAMSTMVDELHKRFVDQALTRGVDELDVKLTYGEMFLYHALMQDYGLGLVGEERFIPLMERSAQRIRTANGK